MIHDAHCHFFSDGFFRALARELPDVDATAPAAGDTLAERLGWTPPGTDQDLADRWVQELDAHGVSRAMLIASVPADQESVSVAVRRAPDRFVGAFMVDPNRPDAPETVRTALGSLGLTCVCLLPAMHRYRLDGESVSAVLQVVDQFPGTVVFVHCGALSVGVRTRLGLPSRFDIRLGDPLAVHLLAKTHPKSLFVIPHFGAGLFREALMAADLSSNVFLDTSSSNKWIGYYPGLTLTAVFRQALAVTGAERLLFGTDSSFFPRGWQRPVWEAQTVALEQAGADAATIERVLSGTFDEIFGLSFAE